MEQAVQGALEVTGYGTRQSTDSNETVQQVWERLTPYIARKDLGLTASQPIISTPGTVLVLPSKKSIYQTIVKECL